MAWWLYVIIGVAVVLVTLILVVLIRTAMFRPKNNVKIDKDEIAFDKDNVVKNLQELIRCKTVSYKDSTKEDNKEFEKLISLIPKLYPFVAKTCSMQRLPDRALLFLWKGKKSEKPSVMMAHYDVVPVNEELWKKPAFDAIIEDGYLWGRGALDTKVTFNGVLSSANYLIEKGFIPENDVYFAFSGGEEISGMGAVNIVNYFKENGIKPELVVDEGGAVVKNIFPGVKESCGFIGIAEKGMMEIEYSVESNGGHASAPKPHSPVVELASTCQKVENKPLKAHLSEPVKKMFDTVGRYSNFVYRMIFANLWLFGGLFDKICKKSGGTINALMRTTVAFTQLSGSKASNVIPPKATMVSNIRINPEDNIDGVLEHIKKAVNNDNVTLTLLPFAMNPSPISKTNCDSWNKVASAVASTWKGAVVAPYLMVQCSDSRHYGEICDKVYRFSAYDASNEEIATIHGNNERIKIETVHRSVEFYIRLMREC